IPDGTFQAALLTPRRSGLVRWQRLRCQRQSQASPAARTSPLGTCPGRAITNLLGTSLATKNVGCGCLTAAPPQPAPGCSRDDDDGSQSYPHDASPPQTRAFSNNPRPILGPAP